MKNLILIILRRLDPFPAPEAVILQEARHERGHAGDGELLDALTDLQTRGFIASSFDELSGDRRWALTEKGRAYGTPKI